MRVTAAEKGWAAIKSDGSVHGWGQQAIGLDIGAASPAEIAVAVLAQIIRALRTRGLAGPRVQKGEAA